MGKLKLNSCVDSEQPCKSQGAMGDLSQAAQPACQQHGSVNGQQYVFYYRRVMGGVCARKKGVDGMLICMPVSFCVIYMNSSAFCRWNFSLLKESTDQSGEQMPWKRVRP